MELGGGRITVTKTWVQVLSLVLTSCMTLSKYSCFAVPHFLHLYSDP